MSHCALCPNGLETICLECKESYCYPCSILRHLRKKGIKNHSVNLICDECESETCSVFCQSCDQNLCPSCDKQIHNKGKRAQHTRDSNTFTTNLKNVKSAIYLSLPFIQQQFDLNEPSKFEEKFNELNDEISQTILLANEQFSLYFTFIDPAHLNDPQMAEVQKFLKELNIKNFLFFTNDDYDDIEKNLPPFLEEKSFDDNEDKIAGEMKCALILYNILKEMETVDYICVLDAYRNNSLTRILKNIEEFGGINFSLNFDPKSPKPFEVTRYVKEESIKTLQSPNKSLTTPKPGNFIGQSKSEIKHKTVSEPFVPFGVQGNKIFQELSEKKESSFSLDVFSFQEPAKANQSFDELLLNNSADHSSAKKPPAGKSRYSNRKFVLDITQQSKKVEINGSIKVSYFLQQELIRFASEGDLLISKDLFVERHAGTFLTKFQSDIEDVLAKAESSRLIHVTIRKFLDMKPLSYIGLLLDSLTIESLTWIVKSIKIDMMTPTEKLIVSRIKECYGLKIEQNEWRNIVNFILQGQQEKGHTSKCNSSENLGIFPLKALKVLDPVTHSDTYVIYLNNDQWIPEDQGTVEENTNEWRVFIKFIEEFFKEDEVSVDQLKPPKETRIAPSELEGNDSKEKKSTWSSSVENILNRSTSKKDKSQKMSEDIKAIPGGRYGCAQFIKICGPEILKKLSIGRLTLFVQEAINKGHLRYQRTLLVKNNPNDSILSTQTEGAEINTSMSQDPAHEKKNQTLKLIKNALIETLAENPEGISLAQIPLHLRKKLDFPINFQDLGFPKLKNFLATMTDIVKIESSGTNHSFAMLKNPSAFNKKSAPVARDNNTFLPEYFEMQGSNSFTLQNSFENNSNMGRNLGMPDRAQIQPKKFNTMTPSSETKHLKMQTTRKKLSNLDDYLYKIRGLIDQIVKENCYGISINKLYTTLGKKLGVEFDFRLFDCHDFYEFLLVYAEILVDIEIRRNDLIIYPKNFRFGPPSNFPSYNLTQEFVGMNNPDQQKTPVKGPESFEPNSERKGGYFLNPNATPFNFGNNKQDPQMDLETPPGLGNPMNKRPYPINNNRFAGFSNNKMPIKSDHNPNMLNISPIVFYGNEEDTTTPDKETPKHNRSISYWNINFGGNQTGLENPQQGLESGLAISHLNTATHSRTDSKVTKPPEESNIEIRENLKFIEELLKDNEDEKSLITNFTLDRTSESFGGFISPNLSLTGITAIPGSMVMKNTHIKTQSVDFSNKNALHFHSPNVGHGRGFSVNTEKMNDIDK